MHIEKVAAVFYQILKKFRMKTSFGVLVHHNIII